MNPRSVLPVFALVLAVCAGCVSETGPFAPQDTTKFTLENTDRFVLLDQPAQYSVTCTGLQERVLADGRGLVSNHQFYLAARSFAEQHPALTRILIEARIKPSDIGFVHVGLPVTVKLSAKGELKGVKVDDSLFKPGEKEILEDLLVAAHADARRKRV